MMKRNVLITGEVGIGKAILTPLQKMVIISLLRGSQI